jgi:hypothetical protein
MRPHEKAHRNDSGSTMAAGRDVWLWEWTTSKSVCSTIMITSMITQTKIHKLLDSTMYNNS